MSDQLFAPKSKISTGGNDPKEIHCNDPEDNLSDISDDSEVSGTISEIIEAENINLKAHIQDQARRILELERMNSDWSNQFQKQMESANQGKAQLDTLLQEFDEYRTEKETLIASLTEEKVDLIKQVREKRESSLNDRRSKLEFMAESEKATKELLNKLKIKTQDLLAKVAEQNLIIEGLKKENKIMNEQYITLKTETENTIHNRLSNDRRIKTLLTENEQLENRIEDFKKETESIKEKLEVLKEGRADLKTQLVKQKKDHLKEIEKLNEEIVKLRESKRAGKIALEEQKLEFKKLLKENKVQNSELKIQLEVEKRNLKSLSVEMEKLRDENKLKSAQVRVFNDRIKEIENDPKVLLQNESNFEIEGTFPDFLQQSRGINDPRNSISSQFADSGLESTIPTESSRKSSRTQTSKIEDFLKYKYSSSSLLNQTSHVQSDSNLQISGDESSILSKASTESNQTFIEAPDKVSKNSFSHNLNLPKQSEDLNASEPEETGDNNSQMTTIFQQHRTSNNYEAAIQTERDVVDKSRVSGGNLPRELNELPRSYGDSCKTFGAANMHKGYFAKSFGENKPQGDQMILSSSDLNMMLLNGTCSELSRSSARTYWNRSINLQLQNPGTFSHHLTSMVPCDNESYLPLHNRNTTQGVFKVSNTSLNDTESENERLRKELTEKCEIICKLQNENTKVKQELSDTSAEYEKLKKTSNKRRENDRMTDFFERELQLMDNDLTRALRSQQI